MQRAENSLSFRLFFWGATHRIITQLVCQVAGHISRRSLVFGEHAVHPRIGAHNLACVCVIAVLLLGEVLEFWTVIQKDRVQIKFTSWETVLVLARSAFDGSHVADFAHAELSAWGYRLFRSLNHVLKADCLGLIHHVGLILNIVFLAKSRERSFISRSFIRFLPLLNFLKSTHTHTILRIPRVLLLQAHIPPLLPILSDLHRLFQIVQSLLKLLRLSHLRHTNLTIDLPCRDVTHEACL